MSEFENLEREVTSICERLLDNSVFKSFLTGSISGTCSIVIFQPLDLLKTHLQLPLSTIGSVQSSRLVPLVTNMIQNEQLFGLWKEMTPTGVFHFLILQQHNLFFSLLTK